MHVCSDMNANFSFGFSLAGDGPAALHDDSPLKDTDNSVLAAPACMLSSWKCAKVTIDFVDPISQFSIRAGDDVRIDWGRSTPLRICVSHLSQADDAESLHGNVPPSILRPYRTDRDNFDETHSGLSSTNETATVHDAIWTSSLALTSSPHFSAVPLSLEPGLDTLVWPLTSQEFLSRFYRRSAYCIHAAGSRLAPLRDDLAGFDVPRLVQACSRVVVWMKDKRTGRMQYLESAPEQALACFHAGHSLYFNPSLEVQRKYLLPLCVDLGMGAFGATADGGIGGDIEVFAVNGKHVSPWHWDAQDNFTIQLKGTKRWSVALSGISEPVSNLHVSSGNAPALQFDRRLHSTYHPSYLDPPADAPSLTSGVRSSAGMSGGISASDDGGASPPAGSRVVSVTLRPGSVLYTPAGIWHRVEAEEEEGSLHINFSLSGGGRWADFVLKRLGPALWRDPLWRQRIATGSIPAAFADISAGVQAVSATAAGTPTTSQAPSNTVTPASPANVCGSEMLPQPQHPARAHAARLLDSMRSLLATLTPEDLLPDALLDAQLALDEHGRSSGSGRGSRKRAREALDSDGDASGLSASNGAIGEGRSDDVDPASVLYPSLLVTMAPGPQLCKEDRRAASSAAIAGEGKPYATVLGAWVQGAPDAPAPRFVRSPLAYFELPPELHRQVGRTTGAGIGSDAKSPAGFVSLCVFSGVLGRGAGGLGALDGSVGGTEPDYRVPLKLHSALVPAVLRVAGMGAGTVVSAAQLLASVVTDRPAGAASVGQGLDEPALRGAVASLVRVLCYSGVLRLHAET